MTQPKRSSTTTAKKAPAKKAPAKRKPAASKPRAASKQAAASKPASPPAPEPSTSTLRDVIAKLAPGNVVVVSRDLLQEAFDEAVRRGRVTRGDAEDLLGDVLARGRKQTEGVLGELEQLLRRADSAAGRVRRTGAADRVVRAADRARRSVGVGPSFPILGYDDLTAAQVGDRLAELSPPQLRKVRDHERRHANRKSVLEAIERALA